MSMTCMHKIQARQVAMLEWAERKIHLSLLLATVK